MAKLNKWYNEPFYSMKEVSKNGKLSIEFKPTKLLYILIIIKLIPMALYKILKRKLNGQKGFH